MLQAKLIKPQEFAFENVKVPTPGPQEVLIKVVQAGICGSDLHAYYGKHPFISCPIVLGHEFVGVVEKAGGDFPGLGGKRVTVLPSLVCGSCYNCETGRFNICENLKVIGCQAPGAFAEYVLAPREMVFELPAAFTWDQGVLVEPLAVAVHALRRLPQISGQSVLVLGAGTIGLMIIAALKHYGARHIAATDLYEDRLHIAQELGADRVFNPKKGDLSLWVSSLGLGIDATLECVGQEATVNQAIQVTRKGGSVAIVGVFEEDASLKMGLVQDKEINLLGTLMYTKEDYRAAMALMEKTPLLTNLITHHLPLTEISQGFALLERQPPEALKVVLEI